VSKNVDGKQIIFVSFKKFVWENR